MQFSFTFFLLQQRYIFQCYFQDPFFHIDLWISKQWKKIIIQGKFYPGGQLLLFQTLVFLHDLFNFFVSGRNSIYLSYGILSNIYFSHKPVYSLFSIPLPMHYTSHIQFLWWYFIFKFLYTHLDIYSTHLHLLFDGTHVFLTIL